MGRFMHNAEKEIPPKGAPGGASPGEGSKRRGCDNENVEYFITYVL